MASTGWVSRSIVGGKSCLSISSINQLIGLSTKGASCGSNSASAFFRLTGFETSISSVAAPLMISLLGSSSSLISKADSCSKLSASPVSSWKYRGRKISFFSIFLSRY